jgi:hypothetical protein
VSVRPYSPATAEALEAAGLRELAMFGRAFRDAESTPPCVTLPEDVRATIGPRQFGWQRLIRLARAVYRLPMFWAGRVRHAVHRVGCAAGLTLSRFVVKNAGYGAAICCLGSSGKLDW